MLFFFLCENITLELYERFTIPREWRVNDEKNRDSRISYRLGFPLITKIIRFMTEHGDILSFYGKCLDVRFLVVFVV